MKYLLPSFMTLYSLIGTVSAESIYDFSINSISGEKINLHDFKGKYMLFVNVASRCGFTKQYAELEKLHQKYGNDLVVIGLPCNQFGSQEPGDEEEIRNFCKKNFGVSFIMTEKVNVKGKEIHNIYSWLTDKNINGKISSSVKWNFQKYIVDRDGKLINYFYSITRPLSSKITSLIK
tara:strand:+ start:252 stop:782 length:531 start_codon:yes stop_codon:yes gene_type:complete